MIDASAVSNFELATIPTIRDEAGAVIYPTKETSFADIANKRGVSYDFDINDAVRNARVAQVPMIVKATDTYEGLRSDLVISTAAAERICCARLCSPPLERRRIPPKDGSGARQQDR